MTQLQLLKLIFDNYRNLNFTSEELLNFSFECYVFENTDLSRGLIYGFSEKMYFSVLSYLLIGNLGTHLNNY